ncbi:probable receptor-like protein kinase At4g10390 [Aegilops tauschii subsp. strangulata]|uniref:probable receptor-like protein kinase At4g10390 n=1 Tax=Aegilops tauschii subsp. strangulata TaxID=200361 RepID=UPI003CC8481B
MPGGSLADQLHSTMPPLTWRHRMHVLHVVAIALEHPHNDISMVHGDVSSSNVLVDGDGRGSVTRGRLARAPSQSPSWAIYVGPFFLRMGIVSKKSHVYGFACCYARPSLASRLLERPAWTATTST